MMNTYNNARKVSEQHAVVLVVAPVDLSEVCFEVGNDGVVFVCTVPVRCDTVPWLLKCHGNWSNSTHYLLTLTPASSFCLRISVLSIDHVRAALIEAW